MAPRKKTFKNTIYIWEKDIVLPISAGYVPDNGILYAVKESLQNALDESLVSGGKTFITEENDGVYIRDTGGGVDWEEIILIGDSGKRTTKGTTGEHGEGEVVSFLAAARAGVEKCMASRNWLLRGDLKENGRGKHVLVLELWKTRHGRARKGTRWTYRADTETTIETVKNATKEAQEAFANHLAVSKNVRRVFSGSGERESLMTNGLFVCKEYQIALGYNLSITPGRDRAAFSISDPKVCAEVRKLFETEAGAEDIAYVLAGGIYGTHKKEFEFEGKDIKSSTVEKAARIVKEWRGLKHLVWARGNLDAALIADAVENARNAGILIFQNNAPLWVTGNIPHVSSIVRSMNGGGKKSTKKAMASDFEDAVWLLIDGVAGRRYLVNEIEMHNPLDARAAAVIGEGIIKFDWKESRIMNIEELFDTVCHELAHLSSGADDCTRAHASAISTIMARAGRRLVTDPKARKAWKMAETRVKRYTKGGGS